MYIIIKMGIGYIQLTVKSESDKYLVGNPQMTFFKSVYRRHTNFAIENFALNFVGDTCQGPSSNFGNTFYLEIPKNGDLLHRCYIVFDMSLVPDTNAGESVNDLITKVEKNVAVSAFSLIDYVEVLIGDQVIDRHSGDWLHIYNELYRTEGKNYQLCQMINLHKILTNKNKNLVYIPLSFWFNKHSGLALPLLALQYSDVRLRFKLSRKNTIVQADQTSGVDMPRKISIDNIQLLAEFIHLDEQEKRLFSSNKHEYLIEQVQISERNIIPAKNDLSKADYENYFHKILLPFNHPVKEILWTIQDTSSPEDASGASYSGGDSRTNKINNRFNYWSKLDSDSKESSMIEAQVCVNGRDIFECRHYNYFLNVHKLQHHSGFGYLDLSSASLGSDDPDYINSLGSGIYCYSFALHPEDYQPSGSLNFSHIDDAELKLKVFRDTFTNTDAQKDKFIRLYAVNYNVLRIMSGSGGLAFIN